MANKRSVVTIPVLEETLDNLVDARQMLTNRMHTEKLSNASLIKLGRAVAYIANGITSLSKVMVETGSFTQDELDEVLEGIQLHLPFKLPGEDE